MQNTVPRNAVSKSYYYVPLKAFYKSLSRELIHKRVVLSSISPYLSTMPIRYLLVGMSDVENHNSSNGLPTICRPMGKLPAEKPQDNEMAGRPARLSGIVNLNRATVEFSVTPSIRISASACSIQIAGIGSVGSTNAFIPCMLERRFSKGTPLLFARR